MHAISVCLYHEPLYAQYFPRRSYEARFLSRAAHISQWLSAEKIDLHIFCDQARLADAIALDCGSVHLVTTPPAHPFEQHLWRYLGTNLVGEGVMHFRGMDNIIMSAEELTCYTLSVHEIIRAPYAPPGRPYMPMRGSCSISGRAAESLADWLDRWQMVDPGTKPERWHSDEIYLAQWFTRHHVKHSVLTLMDRDLPPQLLVEINAHFAGGQPGQVLRIPTAPSRRPDSPRGEMDWENQWFVSPQL